MLSATHKSELVRGGNSDNGKKEREDYMPPSINADRQLLFSKGDVGIIYQVLRIVKSGNVVSFPQLR